MEKYLSNLEIWTWRYLENTRNYGGLHFTAKEAACDAIAQCIQQLKLEPSGSRRTIPLRELRPEDERKVSGGQKFHCYSRLRLAIHEESDQLRQMSFRVEGDIVHFDLALPFVSVFEKGLADVRRGHGDYCIGPKDDRKRGLTLGDLDKKSEWLWFWPCFGHLWVVRGD